MAAAKGEGDGEGVGEDSCRLSTCCSAPTVGGGEMGGEASDVNGLLPRSGLALLRCVYALALCGRRRWRCESAGGSTVVLVGDIEVDDMMVDYKHHLKVRDGDNTDRVF